MCLCGVCVCVWCLVGGPGGAGGEGSVRMREKGLVAGLNAGEIGSVVGDGGGAGGGIGDCGGE